MLQTSFTWLIEQQVLLSALLLMIILLERFGIKLLSPSFVYKLVLIIPCALLIQHLPDSLKPLQSSQITYYLISPKSTYLHDASSAWAYLYITITSLLLVFALVVHRRFVSSLQLCPVELKKPFNKNLLANTFVSAEIKTPMVIGFINSKLVLPVHYEKQFSPPSLGLILEHESIHIQRRDNLSNGLFLLCTVLLWFNPLAWIAYGSLRRLQELSCDQHVLSNKTLEQHILYSKALISCAANSPTTLMAYSHYGDKNMILQRLNNIKHQSNNSKMAKGALLVVAACMLSTLAIAKSAKHEASKVAHISPIVRVEPIYPSPAAEKGLSGTVVLKYDITPAGNTANIKIVSDTPKGVFNRESKKALAKWQYKKSTQGHQDVLVQLDFAIDAEIASAPTVEHIRVLK
jgi:bla regulator protein BlaR1